MANVGRSDAGKTLIGTGVTSGPTFASLGTSSGLTNHGVVVAQGNSAFVATATGSSGEVLTSNGAASDPTFQTIASLGAITQVTVDANTAPGTNPVLPLAGNISITGNTSVAHSIPIRTISTAANGFLVQAQVTTNSGGSSINNAGLASFQSADFSVDGSGFVSLSTTGAGKTITGNTGGAISPVANNWNILGATLSAGTNASVTSGSGSTLTITSINCAKWIVDATSNRGTHTTIASAITAASSGQTIFIRPGTYTESLTLKAGVNLTAFGSDGSLNNTGTVTIVGTQSMSTAGSVTLSGIDFQATTSVVSITGSAASIVNLVNCYVTSSSGSIFGGGSSSSSSQINVIGCVGNVGATGSVFAWSSTGTLTIIGSKFTNTGGSGVQCTLSAGTAAISHTEMGNGISTSSTGLLQLEFCTINTASNNLAISHGGSTSSYAKRCIFSTGTQSAITISTTLTLSDCVVDSTNASTITGAGTVIYSSVDFSNTGSTINTSTKTSRVLSAGSLTLNTALTVGNGGTGQTTLTNHGVLVGAATTAITQLAVGTNGQVLIGSTGADPVFGTLTSSDSSISFTTGAGTLSLQVAGGTTVGKTITGNTGGALSPTAGNWNIVGTGSTTASGSGSTLTVQLTGLTNHALQIGAGTATLTQLGAGTTGQILQTNTGADPTWSTATYPSVATGTGTILRADGTNWVATTATYPATTTVSQILYSSSTNVVGGLSTANNSVVLTDGSGVPSLATSLSNDFTFTSATSGATRTLTVSNTSNTASSSANVLVSVAGATAADPTHQSVVTGVTTWTWGIDNSVTSPTADPFVIAQGTALGTNNIMSAATSGEINYPLQPAFLAYLTTQVSDVTGDGTTYTIIYDTEVFDQNSDFNLGTSTFTAPVTGKYHIDVAGALIGGTIMSAVILRIPTSNNTFRFTLPTNAAVTTTSSSVGAVLCDMDAADTFTVSLQATDTGGKVDDVAGTTGGQLRNWVSAQLSV